MTPRSFYLLYLIILLGAAALRLPALGQRPMHCDEAVHADKFGTLLEGGGYRYDPTEYHGPTLNFLTLIPAWLRGMQRYQELDEAVLRLIPALFGILLIPLLYLWAAGMGPRVLLLAAALTALSPAMVYYSRYYIQEMLLLFFASGWMGSSYRYLRTGRLYWAIGAGLFFGLALATKETFILSAFAAGSSVIFTWAQERRSPCFPGALQFEWPASWRRDLVWALVTAGSVCLLLFTSFFSHVQGVHDILFSFTQYGQRVQNSPTHSHPWFYYLQLVLFFEQDKGFIHSEGLIFLLGSIGLMASLFGKAPFGSDRFLLRYLGWYTLVLTGIYSLIDYKTPWCLIQFWFGWILLAGWGIVDLYDRLSARKLRPAVAVLLVAGMLHLGRQAWQDSFSLDCDPTNPYVYAHTGRDVFRLTGLVENLSRAHPEGFGMPIQVIGRKNFWPLPWYLRRFTAVRWWNGVSEKAPVAPVILATPDMEPAIVHRLYEVPPPGERELYMQMFPEYTELRPGVEMRGYAARSLWEDAQRMDAASSQPPDFP